MNEQKKPPNNYLLEALLAMQAARERDTLANFIAKTKLPHFGDTQSPTSAKALHSLLGNRETSPLYSFGKSIQSTSSTPLWMGAARDLGLLGSTAFGIQSKGLGLLGLGKVKRKVFVSYHHAGDQSYYNNFARMFANEYEVFQDKSLERAYDSDNDDYVRFQIRNNDITGSSCTIVLCGPYTHERKYVDWEIKATLDKEHGLIAVGLPHLPRAQNGGTYKPDRLQDNINSGYAKWMLWEHLTVDSLKQKIEEAIASPKGNIKNGRLLRKRNG